MTDAAYTITAPGLARQLDRVRAGDHVHFVNQDDPNDGMCSNDPPCDGFDHFYLEGDRL